MLSPMVALVHCILKVFGVFPFHCILYKTSNALNVSNENCCFTFMSIQFGLKKMEPNVAI